MDFETLEAALPDQIWELLRAHIKPGRQRCLAIEEANGCVLASDARAAHDFPPFARAAMDGYAVHSSDFEQGRARLLNAGLIHAGVEQPEPLEPGSCVRINTGAPMPPGADAVVMVEQSSEIDKGTIELRDDPQPGQYINARASFVKTDDLLIRAGTRINGNTLAAMVAGGITEVEVFTKPRVAQLTTGHELVDQGQPLKEGQIHDSNSIALEELIRGAGGETVMFGRCPDKPTALRASLELGLANDLLCVTGGMSKGTHDLVPRLLEELGVHWLIVGARLKPGKPLRIGQAENGCWVIGLPGNPVSCAVCFLLFARPMLAGLEGLPIGKPPHITGLLETDLPANKERSMYVPAQWSTSTDGTIGVSPLLWRGSGDPFGMAIANALAYRPAGAGAAQRGESTQFVPFDLPR